MGQDEEKLKSRLCLILKNKIYQNKNITYKHFTVFTHKKIKLIYKNMQNIKNVTKKATNQWMKSFNQWTNQKNYLKDIKCLPLQELGTIL